VALVEADPHAYRELAGFQALEGKTWNTPALAGRMLLVRNDREAACYELPAK
jgi:outer membrane protein assembly factor BamB